jgi:dolichyl-phosphate-mannose--protein O-mannosyl transferase
MASGLVVPSAVVRARARARDSDPVMAWVGTIAVTLLAAFLRLWRLGNPHSLLFDETYYAKDAWSLIHLGYASNYVDGANTEILDGHTTGLFTHTPEMIVHPEVGKWLIGAGEAIFGMNSFGWRISSAIVGSLMVLVMIRLARRVTGSTMLGLVAGLLMCFDGLQLVMSRLALLDIYLAFFVLCAVSCQVADRDWGRARIARDLPPGHRLDPREWGPAMVWRPWLLASGVCWGLALGTKWSAIFPLAAMGLLTWAWGAGARRSFGVGTAWLKAAFLDALPAFGYVVVLPGIIYVASWTGWLMHSHVYELGLSSTQYGPYWGNYIKHDPHGFFPELWQSLRDLYHYHQDVFNFHDKFLNTSTHIYQSNPEGWLILNRPVGVDAVLSIPRGEQGCTATGSATCLRQILLLGTPVLWWFCSIAGIWAVYAWIARRDWRYGIVVVGVITTWLPWMHFDTRPIFSYYAVTILPFLILGAVMLFGEMIGDSPPGSRRRQLGVIAAGVVVVLVMLNFAWFWPIYTDGLLTQSQWLQRIWFKRWI